MDNTPMLDLAFWVRLRWQLQPKIAVGDTRYGTVENIVGLAQRGIQAYLPTPDLSQRNEFYPAVNGGVIMSHRGGRAAGAAAV